MTDTKHRIKTIILLIILSAVFFIILNVVLNYIILLSSSTKYLNSEDKKLPKDYYSFSVKYLYTPPEKLQTKMVVLMAFAGAMIIVWKKESAYERKQKNKDIDGSERWLTVKELSKEPLKKDIYFVPKTDIYHSEKSGIILCETKNGYYVDTSTVNSLIIGTTRSGKGQTVVLPLIRMIATGRMKQSMVINDPKGEIIENTYSLLKDNYKIVVLNLRDTAYSSKWNPLGLIIEEYKKQRASDNCDLSKTTELVGELAKVFTDNPSSDPFWTVSAKSLLSAIILYLLEKGYDNNCLDKLNMYSVYQFFSYYGSKNTTQIIGERLIPKNALNEIFSNLPLGNPAQIAYTTSKFSEGDTRSSIFTTLASNLEIFGFDTGIQLLTSGDDILFSDLIDSEKPCAIFMVIPDEKTNRHIIASLFITQCYSALVDIANTYDRKILPRRVQFILDEFGNMPHIPDFDVKLTVALGRNILFNLFVQDLNQIESKYQKTAGTIRSNCNNFIYINSLDKLTNEYMSALLGNQTIEYNTFSGGINEQLKNQNVNIKARPLMTATEISRLQMGEILIKKQRTYPIKTQLTMYYKLGIKHIDISKIPINCDKKTKLQDIMFPIQICDPDYSEEIDDEITEIKFNEIQITEKIIDNLTNGEYYNSLRERNYTVTAKHLNELILYKRISPDQFLIIRNNLFQILKE